MADALDTIAPVAEITPSAELPVIAGMDVLIYQGTRLIGWATSASYDEDFKLQPVESLGRHGPRGHKSTGYACVLNISAFFLSKSEVDNLSVPTRGTILTSGLIDFKFVDKVSKKALVVIKGCKCASNSVNIDQSLSQKNTRWECIDVVPRKAA